MEKLYNIKDERRDRRNIIQDARIKTDDTLTFKERQLKFE